MNSTLIRELLAEHKAVKATMDKAKDKERKLRDKIVAIVFPEAKKGTNKASYKEEGLEIKAVVKENISVTQDGLEDVLAEHEGLTKAFKYKHELVKAEYDKLTPQEKALIANYVTFKEGAPELSYEGELTAMGVLHSLKAEEGLLWVNGEMQGVVVADQTAKFLGFQHAEQLVTFLEEIQ